MRKRKSVLSELRVMVHNALESVYYDPAADRHRCIRQEMFPSVAVHLNSTHWKLSQFDSAHSSLKALRCRDSQVAHKLRKESSQHENCAFSQTRTANQVMLDRPSTT